MIGARLTGQTDLKQSEFAIIANIRDKDCTMIKWANIELTDKKEDIPRSFFEARRNTLNPSSDRPTKTANPPSENPSRLGIVDSGCSHHCSLIQ
jgi:hypothetical protein